MKNYIDHETKVMIIDNIIEKKQNFNFLVKYINENYSLEGVNTWEDFEQTNTIIYRDIYRFFIQISNYLENNLTFDNNIFNDLYVISKFDNGKVSFESCKSRLTSEYGHLLLIAQWCNLNINLDNDTEYIYNLGIFSVKNYWQIFSLKSIQENQEFLLRELNEVNLKDLENPKKNCLDNLYEFFYEVKDYFLDNYKESLYGANVFDFNDYHLKFGTWQEQYLLDMVKVHFNQREIQPLFSSKNGLNNPEPRNWTKSTLDEMKNYFSNYIANFVIETIDYVLHGSKMSAIVICDHIKLLLEYSNSNDNFKVSNSSSFVIISYLFEDREFKNFSSENKEYRELINKIQKQDDIHMIKTLEQYNYPISTEQRNQLKNYFRIQYTNLDTIISPYLLLDYLKNENINNEINQEYFEKLKDKFRKIVNSNDGIEIADLFIKYMEFLMKLTSNQNIRNQEIENEVIEVQNLWESSFYTRQILNLKEHVHKISIPAEEIKQYNQLLRENPISFIASNYSLSDKNLIEQLENISSTPFIHMANKISLNPQFPKKSKIDIKSDSVDQMILDKINNILKEIGYKFLNRLDSKVYLLGIHENFDLLIRYASASIDIKELYQKVFAASVYPLIELEDNLLIAHLTQLFPLLEIKIRKLSELLAISPYKNRISDFMKFKDPSSILRKMIENIYNEADSFENIPDFLFIFNTMYNSNSLNIRNEAIHGRNYLKGSALNLAIKVTLICILTIDQRITLILQADNLEE